MYNIDINLLNGRPGFEQKVEVYPTHGQRSDMNTTPILIGVGVAVALNVAVGGVWFFLQGQNARDTEKLDRLIADNQTKNTLVERINGINAKASEIRQEADALATVFNQIKPWSALIQDLNDRIPDYLSDQGYQGKGLQIVSVIQTESSPVAIAAPPPPSTSPSPSPSASGSASPSPSGSPSETPKPSASASPPPPVSEITTKLEIQGFANTFEQVNDFILFLQQSPFFSAKDTRLIAATARENPTQIQLKGVEKSGAADLPKLKPIVEYKIETALSNTPASDLLNELQAKESEGLVVRIQTLVEKGIIKK